MKLRDWTVPLDLRKAIWIDDLLHYVYQNAIANDLSVEDFLVSALARCHERHEQEFKALVDAEMSRPNVYIVQKPL